VVEAIKPTTTTMRTTKSPHYERGRITIQPWVLTKKPPRNWHKAPSQTFARQIETTIVHELLHLSLWATSETVCLLQPSCKPSAFAAVIAMQEKQEELAVDNLSRALTPRPGRGRQKSLDAVANSLRWSPAKKTAL
jgi:hypothetical protein